MPRRKEPDDEEEEARAVARPKREHAYDILLESSPAASAAPAFMAAPSLPQTLEELREARQRRTIGEIATKEMELELLKTTKSIDDEKRAMGLLPETQYVPAQPDGQPGGQPQSAPEHFLTLQDAMEFADLDDPQKQKVMQAYQTLMPIYAMRGGAGGGGPEAMLPMLMAFQQRNPNASSSEMIELMKVMLPLIRTANPSAPPQQMDFVAIIRAIKELQPPPAPPEAKANPLKDFLGMFKDLKELGVVGQPVSVESASIHDPQWQVELEKIKSDRDIRLAELKMKQDEGLAKLSIDKSKYEAVTGGLLRIAQTVGDAVGGGNLQGLFESGQVAPMAGQPPPVPPGGTRHTEVKQICPHCNMEITLLDPVYGQHFFCSNCKTELEYGPDSGQPSPSLPPPPPPSSPPPPPPPAASSPPSPPPSFP